MLNLVQGKRANVLRRKLQFAAFTGAMVVFSLAAGCRQETAEKEQPGPRVEELSHGSVTLTLTADPPRVELDRDVLLTIRISAPSEIEAILPSLADRLQGFELSGTFDSEPVTVNGKTQLERRARLTPLLAEEYRVAPMPIVLTDRSRSPAVSDWFATRAMVFETVPPYDDPGDDIAAGMDPVWVRPATRTMASYTLAALGIAAIAVLLVWLATRIKRQVELMRMSPGERAMRELSMLLRKDLVGRGRVKQFYVELTMIVRRYIERKHAVRAPEQTTEEFLAAVSRDKRFDSGVVDTLRSFLEAADLVKFAAFRPGSEAVDQAVNTAREYIRTDTANESPQP